MDKIKRTLQLFKDSWKGLSKKQKYQMVGVLALVLALPTILGGVYGVQFLGSRAKQNLNPTVEPDFANLVPLNISGPIYGFAVDGKVNLNSDNAFLRIILVDKSKNEYLVYETYSAISDERTFTIKDTCEETCVLSSVSPDHLRIEGNSAKFNISKTSPITEEGKISSQMKNRNFKDEKDNEKIAKLNEIIKKKGVKWVAGETSVSKLTYAQKKKLFSGKDGKPVEILPNLQGFEYYRSGVFELKTSSAFSPSLAVTPPIPPPSPSSSPTPIPPSNLIAYWDWRNKHGQNWITPVKDQLGCGSCWAFAAISTTEAEINLYYNQILNIDLSEQDSVCKHPGSCIYGGSSYDTFEELKTEGLVTESCYPYTGTEACPGRCSNPSSQLWKIINHTYVNVWPLDDDTIKNTLITKGPVPFGINSWWHIMALVGYEREQMSGQTIWIIKNSWGTSWGENGFGKLIVPANDRHGVEFIEKPYFASNPNLYQITCTDKDNDQYCNWGISETKPSSCPVSCKAQKDCDDSSPKLGLYDSSYNCTSITPIPTPKPTPTVRPTPTPTRTPTPTIKPTPKPGCGNVCRSSADCSTSLTCYQPPMPICPPGVSCIQVMPAKVCRNPACPNKTNCVCQMPTPAPTSKPTPLPIPTIRPTPTPRPCRFAIFGRCLIR